jgi:4-aminobutyrate aminotransferase-like enzyme
MTITQKYVITRTPKNVTKVQTDHRSIQTPIPAPGTEAILESLDKYESRSMHGQLPLVWKSAKNFSVFDMLGNKWIDFTSTIFVANVGHSNDRVLKALADALKTPLISCYAYANEVRSSYLKMLIEFCGKPFEKAFLLSAGTEATEAALKLMRMYGQKHKKRKGGIIAVSGNWHGRTLGSQMMSSNLIQKDWIGYQDKDMHHIAFPYPWDITEEESVIFLELELKKLSSAGVELSTDIAGIILESFQGWGAVFYPKAFVKGVENFCRKNNILLCFDEMQSGFARTGKKFGYEHYDVNPDLICCGKGMGGGVALSGVIGRADIMDLPDVGNMSSTHSANPLACAAGIAVLEEIADRKLVSESERKGKILFDLLNSIQRKYPERVFAISGQGMIAAILFKSPKTDEPDSYFASVVSELCMQKGLLVVHTGRESIKIGPPLTITDQALIEGLSVLEESIQEAANDDR